MAPESYKCIKERELGIMGVKIENIEKSTLRVEKKLDGFIATADTKYATKDELRVSIGQLNKDNVRQDDEIKWTRQKIFDFTYKIAMMAGILFVIIKSSL